MSNNAIASLLVGAAVGVLFVGMMWDGPLSNAEKIASVVAIVLVVVPTILLIKMRPRK